MPTAGLTIDKTPEVQALLLGHTATFTIVVKNTGTLSLTNVVVTDAQVPNCNKTIGTLNAGVQQVYTCIKANVTESFLNEAVVTGKPIGSDTITAKDRAAVNVLSKHVYLPTILK